MFEQFPKIARLSRECTISEKIDGTNAQIHILPSSDFDTDDDSRSPIDDLVKVISARVLPTSGPDSGEEETAEYLMLAGSKNRYLDPNRQPKADDNFGFAAWARDHADELWQLGPGRHYGEWWGSGIQRGYGLPKGEKLFSLFNITRWADDRDREKFPSHPPSCCHVVPVIKRCMFTTQEIDTALQFIRDTGSQAAPGFMKPEGIAIFHTASGTMYKKTIEGDEKPKGLDV